MEAQQVTLRWPPLCNSQAKQQSFRWGTVRINSQGLAVLLNNLVSFLIVGLLYIVCNGIQCIMLLWYRCAVRFRFTDLPGSGDVRNP